MAKSTLVDLKGFLIRETEFAALFDFKGEGEEHYTWLPKSKCEYERIGVTQFMVTMEESFAVEKELV